MTHPTLLRLFRLALILFIPFLLVIGSISLLTSPIYLQFEYAKENFPADPYGFTPQERLTHAADNLQFIRQGYPPAFLGQQKHDSQPLYNEREISHMVDVQSVFRAAWTGGIVLLVLFFLIAIVMAGRKENRALFISGIQKGGVFTTGLTVVIGLLAVIGWNAWFTAFHQLFFQPGSWTFAQTDTLIRLFPLPFWFDSALTVSGLTLLGGILLAVLSRFFKNTGVPV